VVFLTSMLAGLVAFVVAVVLYAVVGFVYVLSAMPSPPPSTTVGVDLSSAFLPLWSAVAPGLVAFAAAFHWMFRRSSRTS
jgi:hypothetical protein